MAHFAQLDEDNMVIQVVVVGNDVLGDLDFPESEAAGAAFLETVIPGKRWVQTSYNGKFRKVFAGPGHTFYQNLGTEHGAFCAPPEFDSFVFDPAECKWVAPIPKPTTPGDYFWDERTQSWALYRVATTTIGE
jgi:hypothetical protein